MIVLGVDRQDLASAPQLSVAIPAVRGCASLVFERRGSRTVLARSRIESPMTVIRPFPLPDGRLVVQLITLGPGLCGGDTLEVDVTAGGGAKVIVTTTARVYARTGVEMEAMVGCAAGALCVYDMVKGIERGVVVERIELLEKSGGRSGTWRRDDDHD